MPLDDHALAERAGELNARYRHHAAIEVLHHALSDPQVGKTALVSSFGAESVVLLHMISRVDRSLPVLFLDTQMLVAETLEYQREVAEKLGLSGVRVLDPDLGVAAADPDGTLNRTNPDLCCSLRKTLPLQHALAEFDAWITGRKRFQGGARAALDFFEVEEGTGRLKINPLAHWERQDVQDYIANNSLPRHPLVAQGYPSIGCAPCTSRVAPGEDPRAGRWRGQDKDECGIHFENGRVVRKARSAA